MIRHPLAETIPDQDDTLVGSGGFGLRRCDGERHDEKDGKDQAVDHRLWKCVFLTDRVGRVDQKNLGIADFLQDAGRYRGME